MITLSAVIAAVLRHYQLIMLLLLVLWCMVIGVVMRGQRDVGFWSQLESNRTNSTTFPPKSSHVPPSPAHRSRHINQLLPPLTKVVNNIETRFLGHIIRRDTDSVLMASKELDRTCTYTRPSSVPSVRLRSSVSSVAFGTHSYPKVEPPTRLTESTWLRPQRSL